MQTNNGRIWFEAGIDDSQLKKGVTSINRDFSSLQQGAGQTGNALGNMWQQAAVGLGAYLTAQQALQIGQNVMQLTRQRELMETSFEVMFGGIDAAKEKIDEVREYAIFSPYTFEGVADGVKTLSAFGVEAERIMPSIQMIGDVAAGNNERFQRLSLVFAQTASAGKLMGQDLLQYVNSGFNPLQEMARTTGRDYNYLREQMAEGNITFEDVANAFKSATSEGGKFNGMTLKMADSIEAAATNFESAWVEKQIEWGKQNEDIIKQGYELGTSLVENLDQIGAAFGVLVTAVGTYKASLIALRTVQKIGANVQYSIEAAELQKLIATTQQATNTDLQAAVAKGKLSAAQAENIAAIRAEVAAKLESLKATQSQTAVEAIAAKAAVTSATLRVQAARTEFQQATLNLALAKQSNDQANIAAATAARQTAAANLKAATTAKATAIEAAATAQTKAQTAAIAANTLQQNIDTVSTKAATTAKTVMAAATSGVTKAFKALKIAFASNPIGLLITVLTTAAAAWYLFKDRTEEASEAMKAASTEIGNQQAKVQALQDTLNNSNAAYSTRVAALNELKKIVPDYNGSLTEEGKLINNNTEAIKKYIEQFEKQVLLKAAQDDLEAAYIARRKAEAEIEAEIAKGKSVTAGLAGGRDSLIFKEIAYSDVEAEQMRKNYLAKYDSDIKKLNDEIAKRSISATAVVDDESATAEVPPTLKAQLDNTVKEIARVQQLIEDIRSGATAPTGKEGEAILPSAAITDLEGKLKGLKETRDTLLGYDPEKAAADAAKELADNQERLTRQAADEVRSAQEASAKRAQAEQEANAKRAQAEQDHLNELLNKFATYQQKRAALQAQYEADLAALYEDDGTTLKVGVTLGNVENLKAEYKDLFDSLAVEGAQATQLLQDLFGDASTRSITELQKITAEGERLIQALTVGGYDSTFGLTTEQFDAMIDKVPELREQLDKLRQKSQEVKEGFEGFAGALAQIKKGIADGNLETFEAGLDGLDSKLSGVTSMMGGLGDAFNGVAELSGNDTWGQAASGIGQVTDVLGSTLSMAQTGASVGGPIGAAAGAVLGLASSLVNLAGEAEARYQAALAEIARAEEAFTEQSLALARERALAGEQYETILGVDAYGQAVNAVKVYNSELINLKNSLGNLANISIVTDFKKSGLFGWGKGEYIYSDVLSVYPELIDAQGNFNAEVAQTILATQSMSDESRAALTAMVATAEQVAEAYEQLEDYLSNIFGGIGSSITEQIAEGLRNGKVEVEDVLASIGDSLESFIQDMAYSMFLGDMMQKASEDMLAIQSDSSLSDEDRLAQMSALMGGVMDSASAAIGPMEEFFKMAQEQAAAAGIDIFKPDTATQGQATAGEATTINQETAASIDGKLNALLLTGSQTASNTGALVVQGVTIQTGVLNIRDTMDVINVNVAGIYKQVKLIQTNTEVLPSMAKDMAEVKKNTAKL